jgi:hypothetical protein
MSIQDDLFGESDLNKDQSTEQVTPLQFQSVSEYTRSNWLRAQTLSQKQIKP